MKQHTTIESSQMPATAGAIDTATLELLARWKAEDATKDPEEFAPQNASWQSSKTR